MATSTYIALIHKETNSDYGVSFPDLPGCVTAASTLDEALSMAKEALALHVEDMLENGEEIPVPTPADEIDPDDALLVAAIDVPDTMKVERVNVTVPAIALARFDTFAARRGMTRSGLFVEAVYRWITQDLTPREAMPQAMYSQSREAASSVAERVDLHHAWKMATKDPTAVALSAIQDALNIKEAISDEPLQPVGRPERDTDDLIEAIGRLVREREMRRRSKTG
jgi:predicted RNase H-like HicB family nuclease